MQTHNRNDHVFSSEYTCYQGCGVLILCGTPTQGSENLGLQILDYGPKNIDSDSEPKIRLLLRLQGVICDILVVYLRMS